MQIIPTQEIKNAQSFLVSGGAEELARNRYNYIIQDIFQKYPQVITKDIIQLGCTNVVTHRKCPRNKATLLSNVSQTRIFY